MKALQMGIYDDLDTQTQPLLNIDIFQSNAIIFGSHLSGKTTFLKTLLVRMHQNFQPEDAEETYIIDFGGNLCEYGNLPLVAACFDNSNEENIRRVFKTVENKLETNIKKLKSAQFMEAYQTASGQKPLHITLIIDNVNTFLSDERYTSYQDTLFKFCRDGRSKGLSVVFTACDTSNGLGKFLASFDQKYVFDVPLETYIDVFGMKINEPMKNAGRGVSIIDGKAREFQAFLPFEEKKAEWSAFLSAQSKLPYQAAKLRGFGEELNRDNFSEYSSDGMTIAEIEREKEVVTVGLDYYDHLPIQVNLEEMHTIGIYGRKKFGKTNLLTVLIHSIKEKHSDYRMVYIDDGRKQLECFHNPEDANSIYFNKIDQLTEFLDQQGYCPKPGNSRGFQELENPTTVFILQSKMLFQSSGKNLISAFSKMAANAEEKGYYFIYSDIRKISSGDREAESYLNNSFSAAFLLDNIAEFVSDKGSRSVFGEMDVKELKTEYARCELGDGYFYDIESDELKKVKFLKA